MNRFKNLRSIGLLAILSIVLLTRCGADDDSQGANAVDKLIDTVSAQIAETVVEATFANSENSTNNEAANSITEKLIQAGSFNELSETFADILVYENKLYTVFDGGVVIHDLTDGSNSTVRVDDQLEALAFHDGSIYVGGKNLYILEGPVLRQQSDDYVGAISALLSYDHRLLVGTEAALYVKSVFGRELLMEDISITALKADRDGLWIGTDNSGLYRWDGTDIKRRRLLRDSSMFDQINTLDFKHNHLYVGSSRGLHIFDGGRWLNLSTENGLPSDNVTSIDATDWVVYIGTEAGVVSYYDNEFSPVKKLDEVGVNCLRRSGNKLFAATNQGEIVARTKRLLKTLIESTQLAEINPVVESDPIVAPVEPISLAESNKPVTIATPATPIAIVTNDKVMNDAVINDSTTESETAVATPGFAEPFKTVSPLIDIISETDSSQKLSQIQ